MAERRSARTKRRHDDDELADLADDVLAEEPDDEPEEPDDELAEEPDDELAEEPDDEPAEDDSGHDGDRTGRRPRRGRTGGLTAAKAGQAALRQIAELTGKNPEGVTGVEPTEDGWTVGVEILEDKRIPSSTDILAIYETEIDPDGGLVSYRRVKRYSRGRGDDGDS